MFILYLLYIELIFYTFSWVDKTYLPRLLICWLNPFGEIIFTRNRSCLSMPFGPLVVCFFVDRFFFFVARLATKGFCGFVGSVFVCSHSALMSHRLPFAICSREGGGFCNSGTWPQRLENKVGFFGKTAELVFPIMIFPNSLDHSQTFKPATTNNTDEITEITEVLLVQNSPFQSPAKKDPLKTLPKKKGLNYPKKPTHFRLVCHVCSAHCSVSQPPATPPARDEETFQAERGPNGSSNAVFKWRSPPTLQNRCVFFSNQFFNDFSTNKTRDTTEYIILANKTHDTGGVGCSFSSKKAVFLWIA